MKKQFKEQFEVINGHFSETFAALFGGGRAELRLTDPDDVLESGVEIDAQPPGKKAAKPESFVGWEMAFTAIALLFAILKVRPTPFLCLTRLRRRSTSRTYTALQITSRTTAKDAVYFGDAPARHDGGGGLALRCNDAGKGRVEAAGVKA